MAKYSYSKYLHFYSNTNVRMITTIQPNTTMKRTYRTSRAQQYVQTHTHPFNGLFSRSTWLSQYDKGKRFWTLIKQWHQLDHMQLICTSLQTATHHHSFFIGQMLFLPPNQQRQSTEGNNVYSLYFVMYTKHRRK